MSKTKTRRQRQAAKKRREAKVWKLRSTVPDHAPEELKDAWSVWMRGRSGVHIGYVTWGFGDPDFASALHREAGVWIAYDDLGRRLTIEGAKANFATDVHAAAHVYDRWKIAQTRYETDDNDFAARRRRRRKRNAP